MTAQDLQGFLKAAEGLLVVIKELGETISDLVDSITPDDDEAEFAPCLKCGTEGPITTYRAQDGTLKRVTWCTKCDTKRA